MPIEFGHCRSPELNRHGVMKDTMTEKLHLTPAEDFPEDLTEVGDRQLQVLDSQVQRQLDYEVISEGESHPETEFRHYELDEEFGNRDRR